MTLSIVIRAFNEEKHIERLLYGITQQTIKDVEIILVDSGSTDDTLKIAARYPVKIVHISPEEFTFGRSLNRGIAAASGEIIVITSAHCYPVYPDWLEKLTEPFNNKAVALAYGRQRGGESNHYSELQFFRKYFPENSVQEQGHPYSHNANAAIRRVLWEEHQYNENLTGLEDLAWSSWAMEEGYTIDYVAEAEIIHQHDETMRQVYKRYQREAIAMKQILPKSRFSFWRFLYMWVKSSLSDMIQARREGVLLRHLWSVICFRLMQYWGTFRGYHYAGKINAQLHRTFYYPPNILDYKFPKPRPIEPIDYASKRK
jgi:glycosyltransferase involved in cell wall biosynthesis